KTLKDQGIKIGDTVAKLKRFTMVKNYVGALAVSLEAEDFSTPPRLILFKFNEDEKRIPVKWAIGVMVSDGALQQMEKGYFTFKELDKYIAMAEEMGHYVPESIKEPKVTVKEMKKALKTNNVAELKKIIPGLSKKSKMDLITLGQGRYNHLNMEVISLIEKELGVSLKSVDLTPVVE
ncbi:hypothetical protein DRO61_11780, partial [Candidatus Bathyarchaeota archaeon]